MEEEARDPMRLQEPRGSVRTKTLSAKAVKIVTPGECVCECVSVCVLIHSEMLDFCCACQEFRSSKDPKELRPGATAIYTEFVRANARVDGNICAV